MPQKQKGLSFAAVAAAMLLMAGAVSAQTMDVHMKLSGDALRYIEQSLARQIQRIAPHNEVNFTLTIPHLTLYLTEYVDTMLPAAVAALDRLMPRLAKEVPQCNVTLGKPVASGQYFMWTAEVPECLQKISDEVTRTACLYRNRDQEVPEWVYNLPEPQRSERIELVKKYGSPGVFQYFDPHVTLAWSSQDDLTQLLKLAYPSFTIPLETIGFGVVGDHGTVIRNSDVATWSWH